MVVTEETIQAVKELHAKLSKETQNLKKLTVRNDYLGDYTALFNHLIRYMSLGCIYFPLILPNVFILITLPLHG